MSDNFTRFRMTWLDQIYDDAELNSAARDIAFRISRLFNRKRYTESGNCTAWPSHETLAREAGCASRTVQRAIALLKKKGHLDTSGNGGRHCTLTYFAIIKTGKTIQKPPVDGDAKGGQESPPLAKSDAAADEKVDIFVPKGGHLKPQKVDKNVRQTSLNKTFDEILDAPDTSPARAPVGIVALSLLANGPGSLPPLPPMLRGKEAMFPDLVMDHQASHGWPDLHLRCQEPGLRCAGLSRMAFEMEPVAVNGEGWLAWKAEYRRRGWPMPKPLAGLACFPEGGPERLAPFLERMQVAMLDDAVSRSENVVRLAGSGR